MPDNDITGLRCSDVLELSGAFVLGALPPDQAAAVREHLASCPEAHAEVTELASVVPALFETVQQVDAPTGLKQRILAAAAAEQDAMRQEQRGGLTRASAAPRATAAEPLAVPRPAVGNERSIEPLPAADTQRRGFDVGALFRRPIWAGLAAAAVVAAVALGALNLQLRSQIDGLTAYREGVVEVLEEAARPGAQLAVLSAPEDPTGPTGLAAVGADGSVAMVVRDLAPTIGSQVYEAWLIGTDGTPIPIGSFRVDDSRTTSFTTARASLGPGVTVALTLEPGPGATTPTLPVVAAGTAQGEAS